MFAGFYGYREEEYGRFESFLVRNSDNAGIAYTESSFLDDDFEGYVRLTKAYRKADKQAVVAFAEKYDMTIIWED